MKKDTKEAIGGFISLIIMIATFITIVALVVKVWTPTNFNDTSKYTTKEYYVEQGDCAWDIYNETCSNVDWNEWCDFVIEVNNLSSIGTIRAGTTLIIPIPKK